MTTIKFAAIAKLGNFEEAERETGAKSPWGFEFEEKNEVTEDEEFLDCDGGDLERELLTLSEWSERWKMTVEQQKERVAGDES